MPQDRAGLRAAESQPARNCPPLPAAGTASHQGRRSFPTSLLIVKQNEESKWPKEEKAGFI